MTDENVDLHDRQAKAVTKAVAKLMAKLGPQGFTPEAIFEGAVKGGAVVLLTATPATADDIADLLTAFADETRTLAKPNLRVVQ